VALLEVRELRVHFSTDEGELRAVDGISFTVDAGEVLCLVGESGSGKTVAALALLRLLPAPAARIVGGTAHFHDRRTGKSLDLLTASQPELRRVRGRRIAMVFQDPMTSLNPYLTVGAQLAEVLEIHEGVRGPRALERVVHALRDVGIAGAERVAREHPHRLSGGMRQRAMLAMALLCAPELLVADEPTTALDVTIQAQLLELVAARKRQGLGVLWITHDLGVVARLADRVAVMVSGRLVEWGDGAAVLGHPRHPYTLALQRALPPLEGPVVRPLPALTGHPTRRTEGAAGCPFRARCERAMAICEQEFPSELELDAERGAHVVCCHAVRGET
jgi:oligopeptide/dipeptide ABC transporter ATP-binding protein